MKPIIKVSGLGKKYRLGARARGNYSTLRESLVTAFKKPFVAFSRKNGEESNTFWALRDVDFEVMPGEVVGIVGRNGAGKSTLLKILSRITEPTTGRAEIFGRIGSLLEVGTGFHAELTGRENIYLNGAILGMKRSEIAKKFDEIVDFAEVEDFLDTPVKRYSSGMYMRLAFAVAANLEPEILVVDEVLSVGDAEFQRKCLGKMQSVSEAGRTVLFVSHNLTAVSQLCTRSMLLKAGEVQLIGPTSEVVEHYLASSDNSSTYVAEDDKEREAQILSVTPHNRYGVPAAEFTSDEEIMLRISIKNFSKEEGLVFTICVRDLAEKLVSIDLIDLEPMSGYQDFEVTLPKGLLMANKLKFDHALWVPGVKVLDMIPEPLFFEVIDTSPNYLKYGDIDRGLIKSNLTWTQMQR